MYLSDSVLRSILPIAYFRSLSNYIFLSLQENVLRFVADASVAKFGLRNIAVAYVYCVSYAALRQWKSYFFLVVVALVGPITESFVGLCKL